MCDLTNPIFTSEEVARNYLQSQRWPDGPICPHCGGYERIKAMKGKAHRPGLFQCGDCRGQFSVTVGTVFERSKIGLHKWLLATHLLSSSKKGISTHQLHRMLGVTYKTAWFMTHRLREAMRDDNPSPLGGSGKVIEADETYVGGSKRGRNKLGRRITAHDKMKVVGLVERGGKARTFHVSNVNARTVRRILVTNADRRSDLNTDEAMYYRGVGLEFHSHEMVNHVRMEYARGDTTTNTIEGFFSIFKRGMKGVYQHCSEKHLQRYLTEFDFRYNHRDITDAERRDKTLQGIAGKRLTYRRIDKRANV